MLFCGIEMEERQHICRQCNAKFPTSWDHCPQCGFTTESNDNTIPLTEEQEFAEALKKYGYNPLVATKDTPRFQGDGFKVVSV